MNEAPASIPAALPSTSNRPTGRRAQQRADTRERLFQCALQEFREVGLAGAQIDRIAKAAGVVRGTFYFHFATKDHVLFELQHRVEHRTLQRVGALQGDAPLKEILDCTVGAIIEAVALADSGEVLREMMSLYVRHPTWNEEGADVASNDRGQTLGEVLATHFEARQQSGEIRTDMSAEQISAMFLTSTFGFVAHYEGDDLRNLLGSLIDIVAKGIHA